MFLHLLTSNLKFILQLLLIGRIYAYLLRKFCKNAIIYLHFIPFQICESTRIAESFSEWIAVDLQLCYLFVE